MKIIQSSRQWILIIALPLLLISFSILYFPQVSLQIFRVHGLALLVLAGIAISPWGSIRLGHYKEERYSWSQWFLLIIGLQLCLMALFLGVTTICGLNAPSPQFNLFKSTLTQLSIKEGLFPWAFYTLIAIIMGYYSYCRREDAYLFSTLKLFTQRPLIRIVVNFMGRLATTFAYSSTFALIGLLGASAATATSVVTGFFLTPILVSILLLFISITQIYKRNVTKALGKYIPLIPGLFLWVAFLGVAIWLINGFLAPLTHIPMEAPSLLQHWLNFPWQWMWLIFANCWWLLWAPIIGITLARISRGYCLREIIGMILLLPLLTSLILWILRSSSWAISPVMATFIAAIGLLGLFFLTLHKKGVPSFILSYLPRHDHYKFRSYRASFIKLIQIAAAFLFIYLPGGVITSNFFFFAAALPLLIIIVLGSIALLKLLSNSRFTA